MKAEQAGHHSAAHTMAALPQRKGVLCTMGTNETNTLPQEGNDDGR
jgi:hypothetical protein